MNSQKNSKDFHPWAETTGSKFYTSLFPQVYIPTVLRVVRHFLKVLHYCYGGNF